MATVANGSFRMLSAGDEGYRAGLAEGNYVTPKSFESMVVYAPRPYTEYTGGGLPAGGTVNSVYTHATPDAPMRVPICAAFLSFPYVFGLVGAPAGMVVQQLFEPDEWGNYGWIYWETPVEGDYTFDLTIVDQRNVLGATISMALNVGDDNGVFFNSNAGVDGSGTKASPFNTWSSVLSANETKILYLREGTHAVNSDGAFSSDDTRWLVGYEGETFTFTFTAGTVTLNEDNSAALNLTFNGSDTDLVNPRVLRFFECSRVVAGNIQFNNCDNNSTSLTEPNSNDNNDILQANGLNNDTTVYVVFKNIRMDSCNTAGNGAAIKPMYGTYSAIEDVVITNATNEGYTGESMVSWKHTTNNSLGRLIRVNSDVPQEGKFATSNNSDNMLFEFNSIVCTPTVQEVIKMGSASNDTGDNTIFRRNTVLTNTTELLKWETSATAPGTVYVEDNIGINSDDTFFPSSRGNWVINNANNLADTYANRTSVLGVDDEGDLAVDDENFGLYGWQIG